MTLKIKTIQSIDVQEWDRIVVETYKRPYSFQQQDGCKDRGNEKIWAYADGRYAEDYENDTVPEVVNGDEMGVSFKAWLERDPKQALPGRKEAYCTDLFWDRNFYPHVSMIAQDLCKKGILPEGEYTIIIDW